MHLFFINRQIFLFCEIFKIQIEFCVSNEISKIVLNVQNMFPFPIITHKYKIYRVFESFMYSENTCLFQKKCSHWNFIPVLKNIRNFKFLFSFWNLFKIKKWFQIFQKCLCFPKLFEIYKNACFSNSENIPFFEILK